MLDRKGRLAIFAVAAICLGLAGAGCGGEDDDSIPVITGPTGATGFGDSQGLEEDKGKGNGN